MLYNKFHMLRLPLETPHNTLDDLTHNNLESSYGLPITAVMEDGNMAVTTMKRFYLLQGAVTRAFSRGELWPLFPAPTLTS